MPRQVIKIMPGDELKVKIEDIEEFEDSIFADVYARAARSVRDIVSAGKDKSKDIINCDRHEVEYHNKNKDGDKDHKYHNNIIAFAGGRGTGKTSAMISFARALKNIKTVKYNHLDELEDLKNFKFSEINTIDPSMLEDTESIFEIIIARMFVAFENEVENREKVIEREDSRRDVLQAFQKVYESLKTIHYSRELRYSADSGGSDSVLEALSKLASGSNVRQSFMDLVSKYLGFMHKSEKREPLFLLVTIDDLDMNIKAAEAMLEQIRKYMNIPNVIILMAVKIEQLIDAVEQEIRDSFSTMLKDNKGLVDDPKKMALKYLEKLIPEDRAIHLPDLKINANDFYLLVREDEEKEYEKIIKNSNSNEPTGKNVENKLQKFEVQQKILGMTYNTFGLLFTVPDHGVHYFVPETLRQLHNFVSFINTFRDDSFDIKNFNDNDITDEEKRNRLFRFKEYFLNYWVDNNIFSEKDRNTIRQFYRGNIDLKNKSILYSEYKKKHDEENKSQTKKTKAEAEEVLDNILDKRNLPENISLGDVLFCLNDELEEVEFHFEMEERRKFIFCIKALYSILLHEIINIEKDMDKAVSIIGGSIVNLETISSLPHERERDINRNNFEFDYKGLYTQNDKKKEAVDFPQPKSFKWLHFFLYLGKFDLDELRQEDIYYDQSASGCTYAVFSIWAFAFYLLKPSLIKSRLDDDVEIDHNSLYDEIEIWKEKNKTNTIFPIYSIDFLDDLFKEVEGEVRKDLKQKATGYFTYFSCFIDSIRDSIKKICEKNSFMPKKGDEFEFVEAFNNCPLIKKCKGPQAETLLDWIDKHPTFTAELEEFLEKHRKGIKLLSSSASITNKINEFNEQANKKGYDILQETQDISKKMEDKNYLPKKAKSDFLSILDKHLRKE